MGVAGITAAAVASVGTTIAGALAQVADSGAEAAPFVTGAGALGSGGIIAYVFYQFVRGNLLSKPIAEHVAALTAIVAASGQREDALIALRAAELERHRRTQEQLDACTRVMARLDVHLGGQGTRRTPRRKT